MPAVPALLLAIALLLPCFARATDITFYYPIAVGGPVAKTMSRLVEDFEREHPGIKVTPTYTGTYRESLAKALTAHKSGKPPDLAVLFAVDMYTLIDADAIVPFDELLNGRPDAKQWLDGFYPAFMANSRAAGKTWGIPFQRSTILLYWNKRLFREAGLDPERPPKTWAEMAADAKQLTQRDDAGKVVRWGLQIPSSGFPYWLFQGLVTANGASLMNAAGTQTSFDQPAVIDALQYWVDLSRQGAHPPGIVEWGTTPAQFADGKVAMMWTTSGNFRDLREKVGTDLGVTKLPAHTQHGSPTGGGNFYIFRKSAPDQQKAALEFVRWMVSPERTAQWSIDSGYIAVSPKAWDTPAMKAHLERFPQAAVARDQLANAVAELSTHENQRVTRTLNLGLAAALSGTKTPQQAMQDAQAEAMRILLPYQR
ncbi:MAG TPA: ABC transporter substrate-binding protein [Ramlibacter sp.]|nr:ABC transporter substrate-binding protein [Ramlibacter sp.]